MSKFLKSAAVLAAITLIPATAMAEKFGLGRTALPEEIHSVVSMEVEEPGHYEVLIVQKDGAITAAHRVDGADMENRAVADEDPSFSDCSSASSCR